MSAQSMGYKWEQLFKEQFPKSFKEDVYCFRINNNMGGFIGVNNPCDYMCFDGQRFYLMELKAHRGASIGFDAIRQIPQLERLPYVPNTVAGVLLWLYEKERIFFIPSQTLAQLVREDKKSVGIKAFEEGYNIMELPLEKQRIYPKVDYSCMRDEKFLMKKEIND